MFTLPVCSDFVYIILHNKNENLNKGCTIQIYSKKLYFCVLSRGAKYKSLNNQLTAWLQLL